MKVYIASHQVRSESPSISAYTSFDAAFAQRPLTELGSSRGADEWMKIDETHWHLYFLGFKTSFALNETFTITILDVQE